MIHAIITLVITVYIGLFILGSMTEDITSETYGSDHPCINGLNWLGSILIGTASILFSSSIQFAVNAERDGMKQAIQTHETIARMSSQIAQSESIAEFSQIYAQNQQVLAEEFFEFGYEGDISIDTSKCGFDWSTGRVVCEVGGTHATWKNDKKKKKKKKTFNVARLLDESEKGESIQVTGSGARANITDIEGPSGNKTSIGE